MSFIKCNDQQDKKTREKIMANFTKVLLAFAKISNQQKRRDELLQLCSVGLEANLLGINVTLCKVNPRTGDIEKRYNSNVTKDIEELIKKQLKERDLDLQNFNKSISKNIIPNEQNKKKVKFIEKIEISRTNDVEINDIKSGIIKIKRENIIFQKEV